MEQQAAQIGLIDLLNIASAIASIIQAAAVCVIAITLLANKRG